MDTTLAQPEDVQTALQMCIGDVTTQRYSLDSTKLLIKTNQAEIDAMMLEWGNLYTFEEIMNLTHSVEYTYEEVLNILNGIEWQNEEF